MRQLLAGLSATARLLPHLGYVSEAGFRSIYGQAVEDIAAFLAGSPARTIASNGPGFRQSGIPPARGG
jgi:phosphoglycerate dehydrogenase-like enzyme